MKLRGLMSGGQTGVDRAALDVGLALGLAVGGRCPANEDGHFPEKLSPDPDPGPRGVGALLQPGATERLVRDRGR